MRVLCVLHYPGYLRYYDSVIHELADRGHDVVVAFSNEVKQQEGIEGLWHPSGRVVKAERVPKRRDVWEAVGALVRDLADYTRYLHPRYAEAEHLRRRHERFVPWGFGWLTRLPTLPPRVVRATHRFLAWLEHAIPSSPRLERFVADARPDVLLISPLVADFARQTDLLKSAQALGVPTVLGVASWDHLSTKGLIKIRPDRTMVWNEIQRGEAEEYHHVPRSEVSVVGAHPWDRWFDRRPTLDRAAFAAKVGLPPEKPFVLFLGSTESISDTEDEQRFVRRWIAALRASSDPAVRELGALIRPHPYNPGTWADADLSDLGIVTLWPRAGANPVNEDDRADYFDSMFHSAATVGINTSAMIESAIVGRPVLTLRLPEFAATQGGTVHFHYLLPDQGGFLRVAHSLEAHIEQLAEVLADPEMVRDELLGFVESFVRPHGLDRRATPLAVDVVEETAALEVSARTADGRPVRRAILWAVGSAMRGAPAKRARRTYRTVSRRLRKPRRRLRRRGRRSVRRLRRAALLLPARLAALGRPEPREDRPGATGAGGANRAGVANGAGAAKPLDHTRAEHRASGTGDRSHGRP